MKVQNMIKPCFLPSQRENFQKRPENAPRIKKKPDFWLATLTFLKVAYSNQKRPESGQFWLATWAILKVANSDQKRPDFWNLATKWPDWQS